MCPCLFVFLEKLSFRAANAIKSYKDLNTADAEIIRSGVQSIARGQNEAVRSLGLSAGQSMRHVVLPQAFKRVLPPLAGQFISLVKDTSLVSVIAMTELLKSGREVITTSFSPFEILFCVAGLYLLINPPLSKIASRLERRLAQSD